MKSVIGLLVLQLLTHSRSRGVPEESVISYQKPGTASGDVYLQIATNLAEKLSTPIYSFFSIGRNRTAPVFKRKWNAIETLDESKEVADLKPPVNDLSERDIEQINLDALHKAIQKPEKIYELPKDLYVEKINNTQGNNSYSNEDSKEIVEDGAADNSDEKTREGGLVYFLELAGSFIQLIFGALLQLFKVSDS